MATRVKFGTLFLNNSTGFPVAGGAATGESTTPWAVRNTDWTPQAAVPLPIWGGGPPFTPGRALAYQSYDDVTERIPLLLDATSHDDAANELQLLRQEIGKITALFPLTLEIKPGGSTNSMYADIKLAWIQETPDLLIVPVAGALRLHVALNWIRTPFFGTVTTGESLLSSVSFSNNFSGSPDNQALYNAGSGDLIYEGQPLNLVLTNSSGFTLSNLQFYLASYSAIQTDATTQTVTTSSTTGADAASGTTRSVAQLQSFQSNEMRVIARTSAVSASGQAEMRLKFFLSSSAPTPFYTGPWRNPQLNVSYYDAGTVPGNLFKDTALNSMYTLLQVRSRDGSSVTVTLDNFYTVYYYTLCRVSGLSSILNTTGAVHVRGALEVTNRPVLPLRRAVAYALNSGSPTYYGLIEGTAPVYVQNAGLWIMATVDPSIAVPTMTLDVTARQAPLYKTFRGAG